MRFHIWFDGKPRLVRVSEDRLLQMARVGLNIVIGNLWVSISWGPTPDSQ